jgi:hypothetical protein
VRKEWGRRRLREDMAREERVKGGEGSGRRVQFTRGIATLPVSSQPVDDSTMHVQRPPRQAEFDTDKQLKFMLALAIAAGTTVDNVEILSFTEGRRREQGIKVETKVSFCVHQRE